MGGMLREGGEVDRSWQAVRLGKRMRREMAFMLGAPVWNREDIGAAARKRSERLARALSGFFGE